MANDQAVILLAAHPVRPFPGRLQQLLDLRKRLKINLALPSESHAAPLPPEQGGSQVFLQPGQVLAHPLLAHVQLSGRLGDVPGPGQGQKRAHQRLVEHGVHHLPHVLHGNIPLGRGDMRQAIAVLFLTNYYIGSGGSCQFAFWPRTNSTRHSSINSPTAGLSSSRRQ